MKLDKDTLTYHQQLKIVIILSIGFMLMFTSYSSIEGILTKFYEASGYEYYGRITLITVYTFFGLSTTYSSTIIEYYGYKTVFVAGAICYALLDSSALIIYLTDNETISLLTILIASCACGISAGSIWVAANAYISLICTKENVNQMYGIFQGIRSLSVVIGFMLTVFIFKYYNGHTFFLILIPLSILSIILFIVLPNTSSLESQKKEGGQQPLTGLAKIKKYFSLLAIKQNFQIYSFETLNSFPITLVSNLAYKIVDLSLEVNPNEDDEQYENRLTYSFGIALLFYGVGRCIISFSVKKITLWIDCFKFCELSAYTYILSILVGGFSLYFSSFELCCVFAFLLGISFAMSRSGVNILVKQVFQNDLDMIGINYLLQSLSFVVNIILLLVLPKISLSLCLAFYLLVSIVIARHTLKIGGIYRSKMKVETSTELTNTAK